MKKLLSLLLVAVLCVSLLAGCKKEEPVVETPEVTEAPVVTEEPVVVDEPVVTEAPVVTEEPVADTSEEDAAAALEAAKDYLFSMYKDKQGTTASDFERVAIMNISGTKYTVTWTSSTDDGVAIVAGDKMTTIDVNEQTDHAVEYVLTATITSPEGKTITQDFTHNIPAYKETTFAEYVAAPVDSTVVVKGIVTGIVSKSNGNSSNCLYFQDNDGGYYAYNLGSDPVSDLKIKAGMTVKVTGQKDVYSGTHEIKNCSVEIIDSSIKTVKPVDFTEKFKNAATLKDEKLVYQQAMLVTLKGVEITTAGDNGYYNFKLGDKTSYVRISSSVCPIVAEKDTFINAFNEHQGWIANATGLLTVYDGAFYLSPISTNAYEYVSLPKKSDAEMVAFEAEKFAFSSSYNTATTIETPSKGTTYEDVTIKWKSDNEEIAAIAEGILTIVLPKEDTVVNVTATFKAGSEKLEKVFTFKVEAPSDDMCQAEILAKAFALEEGAAMNGKQVLRGEIVEIPTAYSADYNNVTVNIKVGEYTVQCFRLVGGEELKVGDVITVTGVLKNYKGTVEFDSKCTYSKDLTEDEAKALVVAEKAFALEEGAAMNGKAVLAGEIVEIPTAYSADYNNVTVNIKIGDYTVQCFRLVGGADLKVGDVITVTGVLKNYKGTVEFDSKCTYIMGKDYATAKGLIVAEKAFALEEGAAMSGLQQLTGEIVEIPTAYSKDYNNVTVNIKVGDYTIQAFRLVGGEELKVGDVITVVGNIKNYKGTVEFDSKCTYTK